MSKYHIVCSQYAADFAVKYSDQKKEWLEAQIAGLRKCLGNGKDKDEDTMILIKLTELALEYKTGYCSLIAVPKGTDVIEAGKAIAKATGEDIITVST